MSELSKERPVVHFTRGSHRFEIYRNRLGSSVSYVGYFDGHPSVTASEKHLAVRMLLRKYYVRGSDWQQREIVFPLRDKTLQPSLPPHHARKLARYEGVNTQR
jgi:hypothetical protein